VFGRASGATTFIVVNVPVCPIHDALCDHLNVDALDTDLGSTVAVDDGVVQ
jgi:hypothetical protein